MENRGIHGIPWTSMEIHIGSPWNPWKSIESMENPGIHGNRRNPWNPWKSMEINGIHGNPWNSWKTMASMEINGNQWKSLKIHENT